MESSPSIETIKEALVKSCLTFKPSLFKPYLASEKVTVDDSNKEAFYKIFSNMLDIAKEVSSGKLVLKIETPNPEKVNRQWYSFYDEVNLYPCLTLIVREGLLYFNLIRFAGINNQTCLPQAGSQRSLCSLIP